MPARARRPAGTGEGFGSGLLLGASLGLVYAPCAGPILAGVITVSASQSFTAGRLAVALAYGLGTAVVLYVLMIGGRRLTRRVSRQSGRLQLATGAVLVLVALLMLGEFDLRFQTAIADDLPAILVNPSKELEESAAAQERLADLRGDKEPRPAGAAAHRGSSAAQAGGGARTSRERRLGSTRRAVARSRSASCAGTRCWWTSGPTPASTASGRCRT